MFINVAQKIEYLKINCGKVVLPLTAIEPGVNHHGFKRLLCNSWLCNKCRVKRTRTWCARVQNFFLGDRISILTLTFDRSITLYDSYSLASACFNRFRTSLSRKIGKFKYVKVIEAQPKSGYAHFHILVNRFIPRPILRSVAVAAGFGRVLDIREIPGDQAQYYVRKYLSKPWAHRPALEILTQLNSRRCSGSHGFNLYSRSKIRWKSHTPRRDYDISGRIKFLRSLLDDRTTENLIIEKHNPEWSVFSVSYWGLSPRIEPPLHDLPLFAGIASFAR